MATQTFLESLGNVTGAVTGTVANVTQVPNLLTGEVAYTTPFSEIVAVSFTTAIGTPPDHVGMNVLMRLVDSTGASVLFNDKPFAVTLGISIAMSLLDPANLQSTLAQKVGAALGDLLTDATSGFHGYYLRALAHSIAGVSDPYAVAP